MHFQNLDETIDIIMKKYNTQNKTMSQLFYEAVILKELAYKNTNILGRIDKKKLQQIYDTYKVMGLVRKDIDIDKLIPNIDTKYLYISSKEKEWIKNHPVVTYSGINWKPLSIIKKGKMKGILGDYLNLISKKTGLKFKYVPSKSCDKALEAFKNEKIDMLPSYSKGLEDIGLLSETYKKYPIVIVTDNRYKYISSLNE